MPRLCDVGGAGGTTAMLIFCLDGFAGAGFFGARRARPRGTTTMLIFCLDGFAVAGFFGARRARCRDFVMWEGERPARPVQCALAAAPFVMYREIFAARVDRRGETCYNYFCRRSESLWTDNAG